MAFNRGSLLVRQAIVNSRRASSKPISAAWSSSDCIGCHDDENKWCFSFKRSFVSPTQHLSSSSTSNSGSSDLSNTASYHLQGGPSHMRAAVFWEPNKPLTLEDFHMPRPKANEVLIKTKGICTHP